jgi:hypothetical protein
LKSILVKIEFLELWERIKIVLIDFNQRVHHSDWYDVGEEAFNIVRKWSVGLRELIGNLNCRDLVVVPSSKMLSSHLSYNSIVNSTWFNSSVTDVQIVNRQQPAIPKRAMKDHCICRHEIQCQQREYWTDPRRNETFSWISYQTCKYL